MSNREFQALKNPEVLKLHTGYVSNFIHSGAAYITLDCGLQVFFSPSVCNLTEDAINHKVQFSFGFSFDGLRALDTSVKRID